MHLCCIWKISGRVYFLLKVLTDPTVPGPLTLLLRGSGSCRVWHIEMLSGAYLNASAVLSDDDGHFSALTGPDLVTDS